MKLKELQQIFENSKGLIGIEFETIPAKNNQPSQIVFKNLLKFREAMMNFEQANIFQNEIKEFKKLFTAFVFPASVKQFINGKLVVIYDSFCISYIY